MSDRVNVPKVLYIGKDSPKLTSNKYRDYEDTSLNVKYINSDENINDILINFNPDSIVTIGESDSQFTNLYNQPEEVRKNGLIF